MRIFALFVCLTVLTTGWSGCSDTSNSTGDVAVATDTSVGSDSSPDPLDTVQDAGEADVATGDAGADVSTGDVGADVSEPDAGTSDIGEPDTQADAVCEPACNGDLCGDDGCGGSCGTCGCGESCGGGQCVFSACEGKACGDDGCGGTCGACDDANGCTDDTCNADGGCAFEDNEAPCDDGDVCTLDDQCAAGACAAGGELECSDGDACTDDLCDSGLGCSNVVLFEGCEIPETSCTDGLDNDADDATDCADSDCAGTCCFDGQLSGQETGPDCGGLCSACAGDGCTGDDDCKSGVCADDVCVPPAGYYWVGGSGNWSDFSTHWATSPGGNEFHDSIPTSLDDVYFDALSFDGADQTLTINGTATCKSMDWTGVAFEPTLAGDADLRIYGYLHWVPAMNLGFKGDISFEGSTSGLTIRTGGHILPSRAMTFKGGGSWELWSDLTFKAGLSKVFLIHGTLNTQGHTLTLTRFETQGVSSKTLLLGSSTLQATDTIYGSWFQLKGENVTLDATQATIEVSNGTGASNFNGGQGQSYHIVKLSGAEGSFNGSNSFDEVTWAAASTTVSDSNSIGILNAAPGSLVRLKAGATQTVTDTLAVSGTCNDFVELQSDTEGVATMISMAAGAVDLEYVILRDITVGGGATFEAKFTVDNGGNTGWASLAPAPSADFYWVGGTGNWSDPGHWSKESGGTPSVCKRSSTDNVYFDANSFSALGQVVTLDEPRAYCASMSWVGALHEPTLEGKSKLSIYGSLTYISAMSVPFDGSVLFAGAGPGNIIDVAGQVLNNVEVTFDGVGEWSLASDFIFHFALHKVRLVRGDFDTAGFDLSATRVEALSVEPKSLTLGTSTVTLTSIWYNTHWKSSASNLVLEAAESTLVFDGEKGASSFVGGNGQLFGDVTFKSDECTISGNSDFGDVLLEAANVTINGDHTMDNLTAIPGATLKIEANKTLTVLENINLDGTCSQPVLIASKTEGLTAWLQKDFGAVSLSFVTLKDIGTKGGALFSAVEAVDSGGNIGWDPLTTHAPTDLYWVGGTGDWSDGAHWSLGSGEEGSGCAPTSVDSVYFDAASFDEADETVTLDVPTATCADMDWTEALTNPGFMGTGDLNISGSLRLTPAMNWNWTGDLLFDAATSGHGIDLAGNPLKSNEILFQGAGEWTLEADFNSVGGFVLNSIQHKQGTLRTNGFGVSVTRFSSTGNTARALYLGTSVMSITNVIYGTMWTIAGSGLDLEASDSIIAFSGGNGLSQFKGGSGESYHTLTFEGAEASMSGENTFVDVNLGAELNRITQNNTIEALTLAPWATVILTSGSVQTLTGELDADGEGLMIDVHASVPGEQALLVMQSGSVCARFLELRDIHAAGGASFTAAESVDQGNNTGWDFAPCGG